MSNVSKVEAVLRVDHVKNYLTLTCPEFSIHVHFYRFDSDLMEDAEKAIAVLSTRIRVEKAKAMLEAMDAKGGGK
jgi:flavin-dependent dehydrogenase